jgi:hypothetical protein
VLLAYFAFEQLHFSQRQGWQLQVSPQAQRVTFAPAHPQLVFWHGHSF